MNGLSCWTALVGVVAVVVMFIRWTGQALPDPFSSHFAGDGTPNAAMPRSSLLALMVALAVCIPGVMFLGPSLLHLVPPRLVSLLNRDYWLAPERESALERLARGWRLTWRRWRGAWNLLRGRAVNERPSRRATYTGWDEEDPSL